MEPTSPVIPRPVEESARVRRGFLILALAVAALFFLGTHHFWVAADSNVDENAYLVSGKLLAQTGSPGYAAPDPYTLVGMMWIGTPEGQFYPKYPLGQTLLVATAYKLFGWRSPFLINPLLMTLGLLGVFVLIRDVVGSLGGLLGMIAMAASPVLLAETNDPDSHAAAVFFTTWGMFLLLRWWRTGRHRHAALAGLLLGLSAITRYTEALTLLPMALAALFHSDAEGTSAARSPAWPRWRRGGCCRSASRSASTFACSTGCTGYGAGLTRAPPFRPAISSSTGGRPCTSSARSACRSSFPSASRPAAPHLARVAPGPRALGLDAAEPLPSISPTTGRPTTSPTPASISPSSRRWCSGSPGS